MLPGFRFLFAAIVLSMSILIFGLGAAALLRAAHEEFASTPAWRAPPETMFAQQNEATRPVLALLRVDAPAPAELETATAPKPENAEAAKAKTPVTQTSPQVEAAPAQVDAPASADATRIATDVASANDAAPAAPERVSAPDSPEADAAPMKIALGSQPVAVEPPAVTANPDQGTVKKRRQAQHAKTRRRMAHRARLTAQTAQPADAFSQSTVTVRSR